MDVEELHEALAGSCTLEHELGREELVVEWLARAKDGRTILLQVARAELIANADTELFTARIDAAAAVRHPRLLPIVDRGEAGGFLFVVRPFHDWVTLRTWLQRERSLPFLEAVRVLRELAEALAELHGRQLAHGALGTGSVLWHESHVLVKDFGLAGALAVSPPEPSEDLYAFGTLAYEVLTGTRPGSGSDLEPVNARRICQPPGLARLVMRCLDPDLGARPRAVELRETLGLMVTPAPGYRARHLAAQAAYLRRRGEARDRHGALGRFRRAVELDPGLSSAWAGIESTTGDEPCPPQSP